MVYYLRVVDLYTGEPKGGATFENCHSACRPVVSPGAQHVLFVDNEFRPTIVRLNDNVCRTGPCLMPTKRLLERGQLSLSLALSASARTLALSFTSTLRDHETRYDETQIFIVDESFVVRSTSALYEAAGLIAVNDHGLCWHRGDVAGLSGNRQWLALQLPGKARSAILTIFPAEDIDATRRVCIRPEGSWLGRTRAIRDLVARCSAAIHELAEGLIISSREPARVLTRNVAISNDGRHIAIGEIGLVATKDRFYFPQGGGVYSSLGGKRVVPRIKWQKWPHTNIGFTNDGNLLVRLSPHGKLHFFDIVSGQFTAVTGDADWLVDLLSDDVVYTISLSALSHTRSAGEQS